MFSDYQRAIREQCGAIMLCVVGGKMSEGINFSDDLCRCVVMVGLPFPSNHSVEIQTKMAYLDTEFQRTKSGIAGAEYYENLCMKAVNQSIGRAIRHRNDYATIVMMDARYCVSQKIRNKLPAWMTSQFQRPATFGASMQLVV